MGLRGLSECGYRGSCSVEKDFGTEGTAGPFVVKSALRRLFFLLRGMGSTVSCTSSLASSFTAASSRMLSVLAGVFRFGASDVAAFFFASSFWAAFFSFLLSFVGEVVVVVVVVGCCCCWTYDFLLSFVRDLDGELFGDSVSLTASLRLRSGLGSTEGSLLLLEKGRNLDDRRVVLAGLSGLNCGISSACGASSEDGLEPPDELSDVTSTSLPFFRSSSDSCAGASPSRLLTRGK